MSARPAREIWCLLIFTAASACDAGDQPPRTSPGIPPAAPTAPVNLTNWNVDAGDAMVVSFGDGEGAVSVWPQVTDTTWNSTDGFPLLQAGLALDLFGRSGPMGSATASPASRSAETSDCREWPPVRVSGAAAGWRVGLARGQASAVPLDSIDAMSSVDSSALASRIVQAASALPAASDPRFRGLPFRVRSAYAFRVGSIDGLFADLVRTINEEANPQLEHFFLVAERSPAATGYRIAYHTRTAGAEEAAQATEVLALLRIGSARLLTAIVNIQYDEGGSFGLLERDATGKWRLRWKSAYTGC